MYLHYLVICREWLVLLTLMFHKVGSNIYKARRDVYYPFNCKFTKELSSEKKSVNWLRLARIMVMSP